MCFLLFSLFSFVFPPTAPFPSPIQSTPGSLFIFVSVHSICTRFHFMCVCLSFFFLFFFFSVLHLLLHCRCCCYTFNFFFRVNKNLSPANSIQFSISFFLFSICLFTQFVRGNRTHIHTHRDSNTLSVC